MKLLKVRLKVTAYISFGSNLGDRYATWEKTLALLAQVPDLRVLRAALRSSRVLRGWSLLGSGCGPTCPGLRPFGIAVLLYSGICS